MRVLFLDFDGPEFNAYFVRQRELDCYDGDKEGLYPIESVESERFRGKPGMTEGPGMMRLRVKPAAMTEMATRLRGLENELDYVVLDFAGSFSAEDAVCQLSLAGAIDLIVIPMELDSITIASCKALSRTFAESSQKSMLFFNRVHGKEKNELYEQLYAWFDAIFQNVRLLNVELCYVCYGAKIDLQFWDKNRDDVKRNIIFDS